MTFPPPSLSLSTLRLFAVAFAAFALVAPEAQGHPPNIVWIWADNLAYGDLACYGNERIETPHIDSLAERGVRFMDHSIAHPVCSPSRAGFLTGRQPYRAGIVDVLRPDGPSGLPADEITLAEALKGAGYRTAAFGKWHLGDREEYLPLAHGFDHYLGLPYSMDMLPTVLVRDNEIVDRLDGDKVSNVTERLVDDAIEFIRESGDAPFFVYFNHTLPHPPINIPPSEYREDRSLYENAIEHMDRQTGRILAALDELGLASNTIVFFSSDNGPMLKDGDTAGLRGRIRDCYEGGLRVPLVASWPGHVPEGQSVETPTIAYDLFPTLLRLADGQVPTDRIYDGQDISPLLFGSGSFERKGPPFYWVYFDKVTALRDGNWKVHLGQREKRLEHPELYDLENDPGETRDIAAENPAVLGKLLNKAEAIQSDIPYVWNLKYPVRDPLKRKSGVRKE